MRKLVFLSMILLILLAGCGGKSDGGIRGIQEKCIITNDHGSCGGTFDIIRGENTHQFTKITMDEDETVYLEMETKISRGDLIITVINYDGYPVDYQVTPDTPVKFELWVLGDGSGYLPIQFNVGQTNIVEGVEFSLQYKRLFN